jgi:CRP-like cAMP-binding protein
MIFQYIVGMQMLAEYIQSCFNADPSEAETIGSYFHPQLLQKGDFFLRSGRPCDHFAFIVSGLIRIFVNMDDREVTQWIGTKNYFTTDLSSFMYRKPARWNMQALADSEIWVIHIDDYQKLGTVVPRWKEFENLLLIQCFVTLEERIFAHLCMTAEERFQRLFIQQPELFNQVPLQYLASMMGMTPETLSRMRKKHLS